MQTREELMQFQCLKVVVGSTAHGTATEDSDKDIKVCLKPTMKELARLAGPWGGTPTFVFNKPDEEYIPLHSFLLQLATQNPTPLDVINARDEHVLYEDATGRALREAKTLFMSKRIFNMYGGFVKGAVMQLRHAVSTNMKTIVEEKAKYSVGRVIENSAHKYDPAVSKLLENLSYAYSEDSGLKVDLTLPEVTVDVKHFSGLLSEINDTLRKVNRAATVERSLTDDCHKTASHTVRLLLTSELALKEGVVHVRLEEHLPLLRDLKAGIVPWDDFFKLVEELEARNKAAYEASKLPDFVDMVKVEQLYQTLLEV